MCILSISANFFPIFCFLVFPISYNLSTKAVSVKGSSINGSCSNLTMSGMLCNDPRNSVLFDGVIPTLTGFGGDMWARKLLTFRGSMDPPPRMTFNFSNPVRALEVVVFNCPSMEIGTTGIDIIGDGGTIRHIAVRASSCQHFVRSCTNEEFFTSSSFITLEFSSNNHWIYLAEVVFYGINRKCDAGPITTLISNITISTTGRVYIYIF